MTAHDLIVRQLRDAHKQVEAAIHGLNDDTAETRANEASMTVRESVAHLAEAAIATVKAFNNETHSWGSYAPADPTWDGTKAAWHEAVDVAMQQILGKSDEEAIWHAHEYLVAHNYYHVGQICAARRTAEPTWDTYAIYA